MKYFTLHQLKELFGASYSLEKELPSDVDLNPEAVAYVEHYQKKGDPLYLLWIKQIDGLENFILKGESKGWYADKLNLKGHQNFRGFQEFATPLLKDKILASIHSDDAEGFSFTALLLPEEREFLEQRLFDTWTKHWKELQVEANQLDAEAKLSEIIQGLVSNRVKATINAFSRPNFGLKMQYVEQVVMLLHSPACTPRLANWTLKQLDDIQLTDVHKEQLGELKNSLKTGEFKVKNIHSKRLKRKVPWKGIAGLVGIAAVCFVIYILLVEPPISGKSEPEKDHTASSFKGFNAEERKQLDSLLKIMEPNRTIDSNELDLNQFYTPQVIQLGQRKQLENRIAENYFVEMREFGKSYLPPQDSCSEYKVEELKAYLPPEMESLKLRKSGDQVYFKNGSAYALQLIVFVPDNIGTCYFQWVPSQHEFSFKLQKHDQLYVVPGKSMNPTSGKFCKIDINFYTQLLKTYSYKGIPTGGKNKLLFVGDPANATELVDLYDILDEL